MRFLLDQNLSPTLINLLTEGGHDSVHTRGIGLSRATDEVVMAAAAEDGRIIVSSDTDFGGLLSWTNAAAPSLLLLRRQTGRRAAEISDLILANLDSIADDLQAGSIVVLDATRIRVRPLPIGTTRQP